LNAGDDDMSQDDRHDQESGSFEESLQALEETVERLEGGDLPLEESLQLFEKAMHHARRAEKLLNEAEGKIEQLLRSTADDESSQQEGEQDLLDEE